MDNGINSQSSLFTEGDEQDIANGWKIQINKDSTAESQALIFDVPGAKAMHHTGQKSVWQVNGIERQVWYVCGDDSRKPSKKVIERASLILKELTDQGRLFPHHTWQELLNSKAWSAGYENGFKHGAINNNPHSHDAEEFTRWNEGFNEAQENIRC